MVRKASEVLDRIILYALYLLILLLPLAVCRGFNDPFLLVKVTVLRVVVVVLLLLWAASCALSGELKWRRTPLDLPLAGLVLVGIISTIFSENRLASLAGAIRLEGLWMLLIYALVYYLSAWYLGRGDKWLRALRLFVLSTLPLALVTLLQLLGVDFSRLFDRDLMTYSGFFTNHPYYAYYLVLAIPVFAYLAWHESRRWPRLAWVAGGLVNLAILPVTNNRASTLGLLVAGTAAVILLSLRSARRWRTLLIGLGIIVLVLVLLFGAAWGTPYGKRLRSAFTGNSDQNVFARLSLWRSSLDMIADRPVQGYGLESFYDDFPRYLEPGLEDAVRSSSGSSRIIFDHPHNQTLYMGVSLGIGGILFYLLLYGLLLWFLGRGFRSSRDPWFFAAIFCAVLGYFVCVQFLYDLPPYTFYFWMLAGLAMGRGGEEAGEAGEASPREENEEEVTTDGRHRGRALRMISAMVALCLATVLSVTSLVYAVRFLSADRHYYLATKSIEELNANQGSLEAAIAEARRAVSLNPLQVTYRHALYDLLLRQSQYDRSPDPALEVVDLTGKELALYPTSAQAYALQGAAYAYIYRNTGNAEYRLEARESLEKALEFYPYYQDAEKMLDALDAP